MPLAAGRLAEDARIEIKKQVYSTITLAYNVGSEEEVDAVLVEAVEAGGKLVKAAEEVFWGGYSGISPTPMATYGRWRLIRSLNRVKMGSLGGWGTRIDLKSQISETHFKLPVPTISWPL